MPAGPQIEHFDVIVVGAGLGGNYALYSLRRHGYKVVGLEQSDQLGGVWNLNRYPGSRVDVEPVIYSYYFSEELFRDWRWRERYPTQEQLLDYLNHVADRFDIRRMIQFNSHVNGAVWRPEEQRYLVSTADGVERTCRFLVMATGNLTEPRDLDLPGIETFDGPVLTTSRWPKEPVDLTGRRIGVIGTGSTNVQAIPVLAEQASRLFVFQRTAHYAVPANNRIYSDAELAAEDHVGARAQLLLAIEDIRAGAGGTLTPALGRSRPAADYTPAEQLERLEMFWRVGGQNMLLVFSDQSYNEDAANIVSDFVREKIRQKVTDPAVAEKLRPKYPLGVKRIANEIGYYETYNRENVTLVDISEEPIREVMSSGIRTAAAHYDLDVIVLGLGFKAFSGAIAKANIRNQFGETPISGWTRGPRTMLGLMTAGFPNLFLLTGAGSPSVAGNLYQLNEFHVEWIADCLNFMKRHQYATIEPSEEAVVRWTEHVTKLGEKSLRAKYKNYMLHVNEDGSRAMIPYLGAMNTYYEEAIEIAQRDYDGFKFQRMKQASPKELAS